MPPIPPASPIDTIALSTSLPDSMPPPSFSQQQSIASTTLSSTGLPTPPATPLKASAPAEARLAPLDLPQEFPATPLLCTTRYVLGRLLGSGQWALVHYAEGMAATTPSSSPPGSSRQSPNPSPPASPCLYPPSAGGRLLAIKTPRPSRNNNSREIIYAEALTLSFLHQCRDAANHVVLFYGYDRDTASLVLEYAPHTLGTYVAAVAKDVCNTAVPVRPDEPILGTKAWLDLAASLVDSLAWVHKHGIIHGDIKPGNILLVPAPAFRDGSGSGTRPAASSTSASTCSARASSSPLQPAWHAVLADFSSSRQTTRVFESSPLDAFTVSYASPEFLCTYRSPPHPAGSGTSVAASGVVAGGGIPTCSFDAWALAASLLFAGTNEEPYADVHNSLDRLGKAKKGWMLAHMQNGPAFRRVASNTTLVRALDGMLEPKVEQRLELGQWRAVLGALLAEAGYGSVDE